jgi:AraC family transcriptional regulator of adaptative response/methylated-DNA-[protein]-cysteine methyltransferase
MSPEAPTRPGRSSRTLPGVGEMYEALVRRDPAFEGIFVAGVKTTGIFCRPTCPARKPKPENVEFFATAREALTHGYRPCKLCRPMKPAGAAPPCLGALLDNVHGDPTVRITDQDLRNRGLEPSRVRRWFKRHHDMTFHAYCRLLRLSDAFGRIRNGDSVASAAFSTGHGSLSAFGESCKKATGSAPSRSAKNGVVSVSRIASPLGPLLAGATTDGVCLLEFSDRRMLETQLARLKRLLRAEVLPGTNPHIVHLEARLAEYFAGTRQAFDLPLVLRGTPFQEAAWEALLTIPYGETRSYRDQAEAIGRPSAVRAVGRANGANRIAIVVPCHRVVGADGKLTGYGGGLWRKRYLLDLESRNRATSPENTLRTD